MDKELIGAIDVLLMRRATRFRKNRGYLEHVRRCVAELGLRTLEEAFLFGGLDAMQQDFASANQMTLPPKTQYDASYRGNRLERLKQWKGLWEREGTLQFGGN